MRHTRRNFLQGAVAIGAGALASGESAEARVRVDAEKRRGSSGATDAVSRRGYSGRAGFGV